MWGILYASLIFLSLALVIRALARIPFYFTFVPANTFAIIVREDEESGEATEGGGNIINVLHSIPGVKLNKSDPNPMNWYFEKGEEERDFLFNRLGVHKMRLFAKVRTNRDKRLRYGRRDDEEDYHTMSKDQPVRFVFYSGEMAIQIKEADTKDKLGLDIDMDLITQRKYPVRSVVRLADPQAFLTSMSEEVVNNTTGTEPAETYIGGEGSEGKKKELANKIEEAPEFKDEVLEELGLEITAVNLRSVTMSERHRRLLELAVEADKQVEADIKKAEGAKKVKILANEADAHRVEHVIKPLAENDRLVQIRMAEAYENNQKVTTFAPGVHPMVPVGNNPAPQTV